jgi:hypothetical protein
MSKHNAGAFGSRKRAPASTVAVQGNTLTFDPDPRPYFADYASMALDCEALITSAGMVLPFVQSELVGQVNAGALNQDILILNTHTAAFKGRLAILRADTEELRARITYAGQDQVLELMNHAELFEIFMNDYTRVAMLSIDNVLEHFRKLGQDIPYVCPFSPGFRQAVGKFQMSSEQFAKATAPITLGEVLQGE